MNDLVNVTVLKQHRNGFGTKELKKKGDTYSAPEGHVAQLLADRLVRLTKAPPAPAA